MRGFRRVVVAEMSELLKPIGMLVLVGYAVVMGVTLTAASTIQMYLAVIAFCLVVGMLIQVKVAPANVFLARSEFMVGQWCRSAGPVVRFCRLQWRWRRCRFWFWGRLVRPSHRGFIVSRSGCCAGDVRIGVVNARLGPSIARTYQSKDMKELQVMVTTGTRIMFAVAVVVSLVFILFGHPILGLLFGQQYIAPIVC
ncbi:MAG: hypothetical protein R3E50_15110 [Halioglobus sp.]